MQNSKVPSLFQDLGLSRKNKIFALAQSRAATRIVPFSIDNNAEAAVHKIFVNLFMPRIVGLVKSNGAAALCSANNGKFYFCSAANAVSVNIGAAFCAARDEL